MISKRLSTVIANPSARPHGTDSRLQRGYAAERRGDTVERLIARVVGVAGDQDATLSAVGLTELIHGRYRAQTPQLRARREAFLHELLANLTVYPSTKKTAMLAGKIDGEQ